MIFGFRKKDDQHNNEEQEQELAQVLFQGALNGKDANLAKHARLTEAGLLAAKELISNALYRRAETVWVEPKGGASAVRLLIDGVAYSGGRMRKQEAHAVTQMLKLLAGLDIKQRKNPQSGGIKADFQETPYELRVDCEPGPEGVERVIVRARNLSQQLDTPQDLRFSDTMRSKLREMMSDRSGLLFACGSPNSGTTTTRFAIMRTVDPYIYSVFNFCDLESRNVSHTTPFEAEADDDLEMALTRIVRIEADIILFDPLRDAETAKTLFSFQKKVALISELKAKDVVHALLQLLKWVGDPQIVTSGLRAIVGQKLIRKLCDECKQAFSPNPKLLAKIGLPRSTKALYRPAKQSEDDAGFEPCGLCDGVGYFGRVGLFEMLEMTEGLRKLVTQGAGAKAIRAQIRKEKMQTLRSEGLRLVVDGTTSLEELQRAFKAA